MSRLLYVVIYTKGDKMKAHPTVAFSEEEAGALQVQVGHMRNAPCWIMSFPEPLEVANDPEPDEPTPPDAA